MSGGGVARVGVLAGSGLGKVGNVVLADFLTLPGLLAGFLSTILFLVSPGAQAQAQDAEANGQRQAYFALLKARPELGKKCRDAEIENWIRRANAYLQSGALGTVYNGRRVAYDIERFELLPPCPPVMAQVWSPGWTFKLNANFGVSRSSFGTDIQTNLGTASSGSANATPWGFGGDGRVQIPMFGTWSVVGGVAGNREFSGTSTTLFDLGPGLGTTVSWRREGFILPYGGISGKFPTISSRMAGQAWQPGWGTFDATLYVGPRFEFLSGSIATNEFGLQNFSRSMVGLTVGVDVDYPLYLSGYGGDSMGPLWPRWRTGIAVDTFPSFTVNPSGSIPSFTVNPLGSTETPGVMPTPAVIETVRVTPKTEVRVYTGLTWALQRNFLP